MSDWLTWQVVDSAFPTGVFAHSWGLEAAWQQGEVASLTRCSDFVDASIQQTGHGTLPLVNAAFRQPERLEPLDTLADAFLTNPVANRASRVQGRTLLATAARVWPSAAFAALQARAGTTAPTSRRSRARLSASSAFRSRPRSGSCCSARRAACCPRRCASGSSAASRRSGCSPTACHGSTAWRSAVRG